MKKIIFLDIDGVLNSSRYDKIRGQNDGNIDESRMPLLKELVEKTNARIVLSSTWRSHWERDCDTLDEKGRELNRVFGKYGLEISDKTPFLEKYDRANEIRLWLKNHSGEFDRFVIIDNEFGGWAELEPYLVKTDFLIGRGLEKRHIDKAIEILS